MEANTDDTGTSLTVGIKGLEMNPCCGTHILSTGCVQMIKLLYTEKVHGGNTQSFFLMGQRVTDYAESKFQIFKQVTGLLSGLPETFVGNALVYSTSMKAAKQWMGDSAGSRGNGLAHQLVSRDTVHP